ESGPCLGPNVADHHLGPATDHCLGSYALLTRPPRETPLPVRLACVKHAASGVGIATAAGRFGSLALPLAAAAMTDGK
ncbi:hypothetical protein Tco_0467226, partial [Tanacetum coccineum]